MNHYARPLLKYLVNHPSYTKEGYTTSLLGKDLLNIATERKLTKKTELSTDTIYFWVRGEGRVPLWAQYAAFLLASEKGWQIVDYEDVQTVSNIILKHTNVKKGKFAALQKALNERGLTIPLPLVDRLLRDLEAKQ